MFPRQSNLPVPLTNDAYLAPFKKIMDTRNGFIKGRRLAVCGDLFDDILSACTWHCDFGLHKTKSGWVFREWLPNASGVWLVGDFNDWQKSDKFALKYTGAGIWEGKFPLRAISHLQQYQMLVEWRGGSGWRLPSAATRTVRGKGANGELVFNAQVWTPPKPYVWKHDDAKLAEYPLIYESHVGMAQEREGIGTFDEFTDNILPRIAEAGYNCVQLMAIAQHSYYASFGYHVSNFYSVCDLFGTPDEFKRLVDTAHGLGLRVIMDLVHSHSVKNELEGLAAIAGDFHQYFKGEHPAWGSYCFNYGIPEVSRMLLSNCRFWLDEYHLDGFRFDGVTSMLYFDHGLGHPFSSYDDYFSPNVDWDSLAYLSMANEVCHLVKPSCWTIAEDVSGMPGLAAPVADGGLGFDYRLAMGVTDMWFKMLDISDENWNMCYLWHEVTNRRQDEKVISYVESHDQALVGGKTFIFTCLDAEMYSGMNNEAHSLIIDRGIALHKMARLLTLTAAGHGYMNFMGNEFGHPEWIDFPRAGNGDSFKYARRQWSLSDKGFLKYSGLKKFDAAAMALVNGLGPDFYRTRCQLLNISDLEHVIAFERDGMIFVFNFNPTYSYPDYELVVPQPGKYRLLLNTDDAVFCGFGNISADAPYEAKIQVENNEARSVLKLYLPARTAIALRQE